MYFVVAKGVQAAELVGSASGTAIAKTSFLLYLDFFDVGDEIDAALAVLFVLTFSGAGGSFFVIVSVGFIWVAVAAAEAYGGYNVVLWATFRGFSTGH